MKYSLSSFLHSAFWLKISLFTLAVAMVTACSSTSHLEPEEQLYTGLKKVKYENYVDDDHFTETQAEVEAALAAAPNGALFGSSYYRTLFPYGLWIYDAFHNSNKAVPKWIVKTFGKAPVTLKSVNPALHASVAKSVLQNYGYFRGDVNYDVIYGKPKTIKGDSVARPRTAKIQYSVNLGPEYLLDSIQYVGFRPDLLSLICPEMRPGDKSSASSSQSTLKKGETFSIANLDAERTRIYNVFRNHGFYYYEPSYVTFQADTLQKPLKVQLRICLNDSLPKNALHHYAIGHTEIQLRDQYGEVLRDSVVRRYFTTYYNGKRSPVRARVILNNMKMRHGSDFSQDLYNQAQSSLSQTGIFSSVDFQFTPRRDDSDTLDMVINCIIEKPYDMSFSANFTGKTSNRMGPGLGVTFAKRNAFRGGEVLSLSLGANYEFSYGGRSSGSSNTYDFTGNIALTMPRFVAPHWLIGRHHRWFSTPTTIVNLSGEMLNRSGFFRRKILSADLTYNFQPSYQIRHEFSPLIVQFDQITDVTGAYMQKVLDNPFLMTSLDEHLMTKMRYTFSYTSPQHTLNPISWSVTLSEAGNIMALGYMAAGRKFSEEGKKFLNTPFSQYVKIETDFVKKWSMGVKSSLLFHTQFGIMRELGNCNVPLSEYFYIGGPSSIRCFPAHGIGPGSMYTANSKWRYLMNIGNVKFIMNLEYRPRLFGSLYGALFVDAGNIWSFDDYNAEIKALIEEGAGKYFDIGSITGKDSQFKFKNLGNDIAVGVGVGLRYDLDIFVVRLDWGFALHTPYDTGRSGYFNINKFRDCQTLNFAIGYPF